MANIEISEALGRARKHSPFLAMLLDREPGLAEGIEAALDDPIGAAREGAGDGPVARRLRIARRRLALILAIGDLSGRLDFARVTRLLSDFADDAIDRAVRAAIDERTPGARPRGFAAIALGKLGSRELNYSSDVDPILLFDPATLPCREREAPEDAAVRIGRRVVELLQARDGDGYVLRVDLRLRPSPEITPIVLPVEAAITYYESQGAAVGARRLHPRTRLCGRPGAGRGLPRGDPPLRVAPRARFRRGARDPGTSRAASATIIRRARPSARATT